MNSRFLSMAIEDVLLQGLDLLDALDAASYSHMVKAPYSASIGKHYRHVLDHFACLVRGVRTGVFDYDNRHRNTLLENFVEIAKEATITLIEDLRTARELDASASCSVVYSVGYQHQGPLELSSTIGREISYCVSHAIHHFAIIRLLSAELGVSTPEEFGVAPSTLRYRASA